MPLVEDKPLVGISACLLGEPVRYDGGNKLDTYLRDTLAKYVEFFPVCPETESGMGVPRPPLHLVKQGDAVRLFTRATAEDMTDKLHTWMHGRLAGLNAMPLCGFILKARSPSCGLHSARIQQAGHGTIKNGNGLFVSGLIDSFPGLPLAHEEQLQDATLRDCFIARIFVMHRWHGLIAGRKSIRKLMEFHARHKYLLMAHSPGTAGELGRFIADARHLSASERYTGYIGGLIRALARPTTVSKHINVLQHIMGYFKKDLTGDEKAELAGIIKSYKEGQLSLAVPIVLLNHYARKYNSTYLLQQYYLNPHPAELMLRNHD